VRPLSTTGFDWLTRHNPLVDWVLGSVTFWTAVLLQPDPFSTSSDPQVTPVDALDHVPDIGSSPSISFVNTDAFTQASQLNRSLVFQLDVASLCAEYRVPLTFFQSPQTSRLGALQAPMVDTHAITCHAVTSRCHSHL
jgi:hypothetical protein